MTIVGHQKKIAQLQNFLSRGLSFPALLFEGPERVGKCTIARAFIKGLRCERKTLGGCGACPACTDLDHDTFVVDHALATQYRNKELAFDPYGVDGIAQILSFAYTTPLKEQYKVVLIDDAHLLSFEAQNKLLKTLEEPPASSMFILVSHKAEALVRTVRSRCLTVSFTMVKSQEIIEGLGALPRKAGALKQLTQYSMGRPGLGIALQESAGQGTAFKTQAVGLLKFIAAPLPERLVLVPAQGKDESQPLYSPLHMFQVLLRDCLLQAHGAPEHALLLSRPQPMRAIAPGLQALRESFRLADIIDSAVSSGAATRSFEYLALKLG